MTVGAAESFPQLDRLVEGDSIGNLLLVHELPGADEEDGALDGADVGPFAVGERLQEGLQGLGLRDGAAQLRFEELTVRAGEAFHLREIIQHLLRTRLGVDPLVEALQDELALAPARGLHPEIARSVLAISSASRAASAPFTAARARACPSGSAVSRPLAIGTPVSGGTAR